MKAKKQVAVVMCAAMAASMLASVAASADEEEYRIAVLLAGTTTAYFDATREGMDEAAEDYGVSLTYFDGNWDVSTQVSQIEDAITDEYDMIAVAPADSDGIIAGIEEANEAGVPIMCVTNGVGEDGTGYIDEIVAYVGQNERDTATLCANIMMDLLGDEPGKIVILEGVAGTYCQVNRNIGFNEAIEGTDNEVVYTQSADWDKGEAMSIIEDLISGGTEFNAVFCEDDGMAAGAGQALDEAGMKDDVVVVGLGGSIAGLDAMREGLIDGDTFMSAVEEGYKAIEVCYNYLAGNDYDEMTLLVQEEVTMDNIDDYTPEW